MLKPGDLAVSAPLRPFISATRAAQCVCLCADLDSTYTSALKPFAHASCLRALRFADDDVKHYQEKVYDACVAFNAGLSLPDDVDKQRTCKKDTSPCHLIQYQSLSNTTTTGGDGLTGKTQQERIDEGNDADNEINDKFAAPNKYTDYNGAVLNTPDPYHQVRV